MGMSSARHFIWVRRARMCLQQLAAPAAQPTSCRHHLCGCRQRVSCVKTAPRLARDAQHARNHIHLHMHEAVVRARCTRTPMRSRPHLRRKQADIAVSRRKGSLKVLAEALGLHVLTRTHGSEAAAGGGGVGGKHNRKQATHAPPGVQPHVLLKHLFLRTSNFIHCAKNVVPGLA